MEDPLQWPGFAIERNGYRIELDLPFFPAPMAGALEPPYRMILHEMGAGLSFTEMVSARGTYESSGRTGELAGWIPDEGYSGAQVFGGDPDFVSFAAARMEEIGHHIIDLNAGCPKRKVMVQGGGGALLKNIDSLVSMAASVIDEVEVPVGVKTRSGYHHFDGAEMKRMLTDLESIGCSYVAIHGRTVLQGFKGSADRDVISFASDSVDIPVIASGDVKCIDDVKDYLSRGAGAVMIGRGLMGNPLLIEDIAKGRGPSDIQIRDRIPRIFEIARKHLELSIGFFGEGRGCVKFRTHLGWYVQGFGGRRPFMDRIHHCSKAEEFLALMKELEMGWSGQASTC